MLILIDEDGTIGSTPELTSDMITNVSDGILSVIDPNNMTELDPQGVWTPIEPMEY